MGALGRLPLIVRRTALHYTTLRCTALHFTLSTRQRGPASQVILPNCHPLARVDRDYFRMNRLYNEEMDMLLRKHVPILTAIYKVRRPHPPTPPTRGGPGNLSRGPPHQAPRIRRTRSGSPRPARSVLAVSCAGAFFSKGTVYDGSSAPGALRRIALRHCYT